MSFTQNYPGNWFHVTGKPYPEFPDWRQLGDMYDSYMDAIDEYRAYYVSKRTSSPSVETINLTSNIAGTGAQKFLTKLNLPDGSIHFPAYQASSTISVTPDNEVIPIANVNSSSIDVCLSPVDGLIYNTPFASTQIKTQDTTTFATSVKATMSANWTSLAMIGGAVADDGTIHFLPCALEDEAYKIATTDTAVTLYGNIATSSNQGRSFQAAINHGGMLYTPPTAYIDGDWYMRKVDPVAETITDIQLFASANVFVNGLACPYKNKVLFMGDGGNAATTGVYLFDTTDNSCELIGDAQTYANSCKGFLAPDGCYYFCNASSYLIRVDIDAETTTNTGLFLYNIPCLSSSGYVYSIQSTSTPDLSDIKRVKLFDVPIDPNFLCNRYLNTT